jgi:glycosyltransferase involved in cell wall biosynthesis
MLDHNVWRMVMRADAIFAWFGFCAPVVIMAAMLRKPSLVIAGGADVVWVPEIGYGLDPSRKIHYALIVMGYRLARKVLLFSESSRKEFLKIPGIDSSKATTLYLGVDAVHFKPSGAKKPYVFSVSYIHEISIRRKGILTLLDTARRTPEIEYRIGGLVVSKNAMRKIIDFSPPNVTFLGYLDASRLLAENQQAHIYAQLSYHEGFGMALAEAMACGCIPVVTGRGSIPEVVGDTGYYVPVENPDAAASAIRAAMGAGQNKGANARARIVQQFPPSMREAGILREMDKILAK